MAFGSLRLRLALWYAALLAMILAATSILSYGVHSSSGYDDVDRSLVSTAVHVLTGLKLGSQQASDPIGLPSVGEFASPDIYVQLYDPHGQLLSASGNASRQLDVDPRVVAATPKGSVTAGPINRLVRPLVNLGRPVLTEEGGFLTVNREGHGRTRVYALPIRIDGVESGFLEVGMAVDSLDRSMERLRLLLVTMSFVGLLAALLGGWAIAGSALRPVSTMVGTARAIALSRGFSRRLPELGRRDELGQLADTFNEMLASLDEAYRTQQRFVADASHELRAPLTAIQGNLELLERAPQMDKVERVEALAYLRREAQRMGRLVSDLLVLARADAGQPLKVQPVELDRLLLSVFQETRVLAEGRRMLLDELDQLEVQGDPDRMKQLLLILVDNAIKYTPRGGEIRLAMHAEPGAAVITVTDTGIGIEPEDLLHVFERFYRADKARSRDSGGSGLGLSIAQWIAERHGGCLSVESTPKRGSTFTVRLPLPWSSSDPKPSPTPN